MIADDDESGPIPRGTTRFMATAKLKSGSSRLTPTRIASLPLHHTVIQASPQQSLHRTFGNGLHIVRIGLHVGNIREFLITVPSVTMGDSRS
jgi:hypothetical protein